MDKFIQELVKDAGKFVLRRFGKDKGTHFKSKHLSDVVTDADVRSEAMMVKKIRKMYPNHGILGEESGGFNENAEYLWVLDPIDGTLNFSSGVPMFGVMACLVHRGVVKLSAVYLPAMNELFFAKAGTGAFLNGKRIHASKVPTLDHSKGCGSGSLRGKFVPFLRNLLDAASNNDIIFGSQGAMSVNVCYVACGRRDWLVACVGAKHDFAPTFLIMKEAGCTVTDLKGKPWKLGVLQFVAANQKLHKHLVKLTKNI